MKKKVLSLAVSVMLVFTMVLCVANASIAINTDGTASENQRISYAKGPFDLSIARMDKIAEMLKKEGKVSKDATPDQVDKAVRKYLRDRMNAMPKKSGELQKQKNKVEKSIKEKMDEANEVSSEENSLAEQRYAGTTTNRNVLAVLMEFPDYLHNSITPSQTDMYYADYTPAHFQEMLFGYYGYAGPTGQNLISMRQYYEQQSGGSFLLNGQVSGWYKASQNAAYYGGNDASGNDKNPRALVIEAMAKLAQDPNINLADYDQADPYDLDGDGNYNEPDGIIDHLMIFHAGVGEEAGGGTLAANAIWSHSWNLAAVTQIPGTNYSVYDYTMQPEDGAAGVCAHEFGHDLGLPDEYDTQYTATGEPVAYWSIMSSGSWAGMLAGTEPSGFSPYCKEYFQARYGGNWLTGTVVNLATELNGTYKTYQLDEASSKGVNNDYVRINLPKKETTLNTPYNGQYEYYSTKGDNLNTAMTLYGVNVTGSNKTKLEFNAWYKIEKDWDYAYVQIRQSGTTNWTNLSGSITTTTNPNGNNLGNGITGSTSGWVNATFGLASYVGKTVDIRFRYVTDEYVSETGLFVDNIRLVDNKTLIAVLDNADATKMATLEGFELSTGKMYTNQYYLVEWRSNNGVDAGLAHLPVGPSLMKYEPGLLIWHVDEAYSDNWVGNHPGEGFVGVVDADQNTLVWSNRYYAETHYQIHDATFKMTPSAPMFIDLSATTARKTLTDNNTAAVPLFDDSKSYINTSYPYPGKKLTNYGLKIKVVNQASDMSSATIQVGTMLP